MDNIQKMVFGVISTAGLLAMLTPSGVRVAPPETVGSPAPPVLAGPPVPAQGEQPPPDVRPIQSETPDNSDPFALGEPSIDGNPIGQPSNPEQETPPAIDMAQYGIPDYNAVSVPQYNAPVTTYDATASAAAGQPVVQ